MVFSRHGADGRRRDGVRSGRHPRVRRCGTDRAAPRLLGHGRDAPPGLTCACASSPSPSRARPTTQLAVARVAEEDGFDAFFRSDHYLRMGDGDAEPGPTDAWVTLGGPGPGDVAHPPGHARDARRPSGCPGPLAISVAEVDAMSGGRVELGLGAGWFEEEHRPTASRSRTSASASTASRSSSRSSPACGRPPTARPFDYDGRHYHAARLARRCPSRCSGRTRRSSSAVPARSARPRSRRASPTSSTCRSTRSRTSRARSATSGPAPRARPRAATRGRSSTRSDPRSICGTDPARGRATGRGHRAHRGDVQKLAGPTGTPDEVVEQLRAYADTGAERAYLQLLDIDDLDHVRLLAAEVAPHLA